MEAPTTEAAIVAGGQARRFAGRDKSRLVVEGRSIIVRQLEVLQQVASPVRIIGGARDSMTDLGVDAIPDLLPGLGAIGGIYTAVQSAAADRVLVVACDLPFLDSRVLRRLGALAEHRDGAWIATTRGVEPLLACYGRHTASAIRREIDAGRLAARHLGTALDMAVLGEIELQSFGSLDRLLANVNTPEDYARVQYPPS